VKGAAHTQPTCRIGMVGRTIHGAGGFGGESTSRACA